MKRSFPVNDDFRKTRVFVKPLPPKSFLSVVSIINPQHSVFDYRNISRISLTA